MPKYATGQGPSLAAQLPEGSLASRALAGLKTAGKWIGLDEDASVEPSVMGGIGPAITMVTKKPLTELLRRLAPRNPQGRVIDPQQFPNITDATQEIVERFPRVASHVNSITTGLRGARGAMDVPPHVAQTLRRQGPAALREQPIAKISLNEDLIEPLDAYGTLAHEFGHVGQVLSDPRRQPLRYGLYAKELGYDLNPYEISSRFTQRNQNARRAGDLPVGAASPRLRREATDALRQLELDEVDRAQAQALFAGRPSAPLGQVMDLYGGTVQRVEDTASWARQALRDIARQYR